MSKIVTENGKFFNIRLLHVLFIYPYLRVYVIKE